jgi:signal transduction histidine kinase
MSHTHPELPAVNVAPLPGRQFRFFLWFWHLMYLSMLAFLFGATWWNARESWGWREVLVSACVGLQVALYAPTLMFPKCWPLSRWRWLLYFGGSVALWWIEQQLMPWFLWLVWAYVGQLWGTLPLRIWLLGTLALVLVAFGRTLVWDGFSRVNVGQLVGATILFVLWLVFGVFFAWLMRASSERGKLIVELEAAKRELEWARERDAELAALRERERLARDMHDGLGHALVALTVQLEAVQRLIAIDPSRAAAHIEELKTLTRQSMDELRRSLDGLRASGLGDRALAPAVQALAVETGQRAQLETTCHVDDAANSLTPALAETLWRVAQEALTNIEKHAHARRAQIRLQAADSHIVLRVSDDGIGLPPNAEMLPRHYGLRGIRERVEGLGGTLTLTSNGGTTVEARLPTLSSQSPVASSQMEAA